MPPMDFPPLLSFAFDRKGGAIPADPMQPDESQLRWFHARWEDPIAERWLTGDAQISSEVHEALMAPETRPRCTVMRTSHGDGVVINLRGVNLHEGAEPEDMISVRIWLEANRIISTWRRPLNGKRCEQPTLLIGA
jgi:zinc transporter